MKKSWVFGALGFLALISSCAKQQPGASDELLSTLRSHMEQPVTSEKGLAEQNALVKRVVEEDAFKDMRRHEVAAIIGKGSPCVEHPVCIRQGFDRDDWVYTVGQQPVDGAVMLPLLIVGFDREGHHSRSYYVIKD